MDSVIIGRKGCAVSSVLLALRKSAENEAFSRFREQWRDVGMWLGTPKYELDKLRGDLQLDKISLIDVLDGVLVEWVSRVGSKATLGRFIWALEQSGLGGCAEFLNLDFIKRVEDTVSGGDSGFSSLRPSQYLWRSTLPDGSQESTIGRVSFNTSQMLGSGSHGTCVYRGKFDGMDVAVKRIFPECLTYADNEIGLLKILNQHENIIRYFCTETDGQFRYIALELCQATLGEWVEGKYINENVDVVRVLKEATKGLEHLHSLRIVHRDVKPANVLLREWTGGKRSVRALISDFGLSKKMQTGKLSFSRSTGGICGTDGWIAAEVLLEKPSMGGKMTFAVDVFALGCMYYHALSGGYHPFGEAFHRQSNIIKSEYNLARIENVPVTNLIEVMISSDPGKRPPIFTVLKHPTFWSCSRTNRGSVFEGEDPSRRLCSTSSQTEMESLELMAADQWTSENACADIAEIREENSQLVQVTVAEVNSLSLMSRTDEKGNTELHRAAYRMDISAVEELLRDGADVNARNNQHQTSLHMTACGAQNCPEGFVVVMKILMDNGADPYPLDIEERNFMNILFYHSLSTPNQLHDICECLVRNEHAKLFSIPGRFQVTLLHWAVFYLEVSHRTVELLHKNSVDFNLVDDFGESVLNYALRGCRSASLLSLLIDVGAIPTHLNKGNSSLLHHAASRGNLEVLSLLIRNGLDVNRTDDYERTPLHAAITEAEMNVYECVRLLVENGGDITVKDYHGKSLFDAAQSRNHLPNHDKILQLLRQHNDTDIAVGSRIAKLQSAVDKRNLAAMEDLVQEGEVDVNAKNMNGETLLHRAAMGNDCINSRLNIMKFLLEMGADPFPLCKEQWNFVDILILSKVKPTPEQLHELCKILVRCNCSKILSTPSGKLEKNTLHRIVHYVELKSSTLTMLHRNEVDFNVIDKNGRSVLDFAVWGHRSVDFISKLVECGADFKRVDKHKKSLLHIAAHYGHVEAIQFFTEKGLDVNGIDDWGKTPLHQAVEFGKTSVYDCVRYLMNIGADKTLKDKFWNTPLNRAMHR